MSGQLCRCEKGIGAVFAGLGSLKGVFLLWGVSGPLCRWEMGIGVVCGGLGGLERVFL